MADLFLLQWIPRRHGHGAHHILGSRSSWVRCGRSYRLFEWSQLSRDHFVSLTDNQDLWSGARNCRKFDSGQGGTIGAHWSQYWCDSCVIRRQALRFYAKRLLQKTFHRCRSISRSVDCFRSSNWWGSFHVRTYENELFLEVQPHLVDFHLCLLWSLLLGYL